MGGARGLAMSRAGQSLQRSLISVLENNREGNRPSCPPPPQKSTTWEGESCLGSTERGHSGRGQGGSLLLVEDSDAASC